MPCYNESATVAQMVGTVMAALPPGSEVIVVDDGSTDGTLEALMRIETTPGLRLLRHDKNQGKGAALRTGFAHATGDVIVIQDCDTEYPPTEIAKLVVPIAKGEADVVYGSRFLGGNPNDVPAWHWAVNKFLTVCSNLMTGLRITDMETGYKAFRRQCLVGIVLQEPRFGFEPEITAKFAHKGWRFKEVVIKYQRRSYAQGKKITWRDGVRALWCIAKYR